MRNEKLTTEDLARSGDDMRGHRSEEAIGRDEHVEVIRTPAEPRAAAETAAHRPTLPERVADTPLFPTDEAGKLHDRWSEIQAAFVDEPRRAVQDADGLVAESMKRLAEMFAKE